MNGRDFIFAGVFVTTMAAASGANREQVNFRKIVLDPYYWSEGGSVGDLNRDGHLDVVVGPYWWAGPDFAPRREIFLAPQTFKARQPDGTDRVIPGWEGALGAKKAYSRDNFFSFVHDFNADGWPDVLTIGLPFTPAFLFINPAAKSGEWGRHVVLDQVANESPTFTDLTGDGRPEIVCNYGGNFGYASPDWKNPTAPWTFTPITRNGEWKGVHGLGIGDVNADGRKDVLFKDGWFEQPATPSTEPWRRHDVPFGHSPAQMFVYDVNGDGLGDVVTALAAHGFGLAWHEQLKRSSAGAPISFRQHDILDPAGGKGPYGVSFSEPHAVELADIDGDGLQDIVTGKSYWSHGPNTAPDGEQPAVLYWFKLVRKTDGAVEWKPYQIDGASGVGRQIAIADVNQDGRVDILVSAKKGAFLFLNEIPKPIAASKR